MRDITDVLREPIIHVYQGKEKEFEEHIVLHLDELCDILELPPILTCQQQLQIRAFGTQCILDIAVKHTDGSTTIFEVKKVNNKNPHTGTANQMQAIGQLLLYQNMYELKTGVRPRLLLIDNKIFERTLWSFVGNDLPITLVDFQKDRVFVPYRAW